MNEIKQLKSDVQEVSALWNKADCFICDLGELIAKKPFNDSRTIDVIANMIKAYKRGEL